MSDARPRIEDTHIAASRAKKNRNGYHFIMGPSRLALHWSRLARGRIGRAPAKRGVEVTRL
ncbi:hypothetical protein [Streptomyces sp. 2112.3]|uniref:hypothetical protein n=1 Tax=Streptomyces sp. 2112.3 TaxID=1881023 RepID=UPI0015A619A3|nr:hypothetical protein [Streptomyces sp. 2112.3]